MATCPKCGGKLKLTDWKPNCPHCGVNITYYGKDEELQEEADKAEVEHAKVQKKIDHLKAAFVGSPLAIVRIILSVLPLGVMMLPLCSVTYSGPFIEETTKNLNLLSIYNLVSSLDFGALSTMMGSDLLGKGFLGYGVALIAIVLSAVMLLVGLFALTAAMGPKGNIRNITNNSLAIVFAVVAIIFFNIFAKNVNSVFPEFFSGKVMYGIYAYIGAIALLLILNIYLTIHKIEVKYKPCYVGGIPIDEFNEALANGVPIEELHERMDVILAEREQKRLEEQAKKDAEKKKKEEEELARKAGRL